MQGCPRPNLFWRNEMNQDVLDRAVKLATRLAMGGNPVARIVWLPPVTAASDPDGAFVVYPCPPLSASDTPPWEK